MQKFRHDFSASERRAVRKWRLAVVSFYGSLLAITAALASVAHRDVQIAHKDPPTARLEMP
ncbi:hypothetical protein [Bradyrhizobium sp. sBnM-33]|uniref:hypothetical protein n=1 Tax=Bradyrhizobium sp. sBnM-33 TaxID=2831780 RepID=UPI001BCC5872|nr:hypothetical protein [Bradyrhizobium sp. sBnM-33]WOH53357.1 hypothetical protein RX328_15490 [Bradyrhizobium sp. sBnM-33]